MSRKELLNELLNMKSSTDMITNQLYKFGWDSDEKLVSLTREHIFNVLRNYLDGKINEAEVENWANAIEGREDIDKQGLYKDLIDQVLHELANPYLTEQLTKERAKMLSAMLI